MTPEAPAQRRRWPAVALALLVVTLAACGDGDGAAASTDGGSSTATPGSDTSGDGGEFTEDAEAAAGWVAAEFDEPTPGWADFGPAVYADIVLGLTAVGGEDETADAALDNLAAESAVVLGEPGAALPGVLGKVILAVEARGEDPATFVEGRDLEAELRAMLEDSGQFTGATVYDQAFAILGLAATGDGVPESAGGWLVSTQCETGDFTYVGDCPAPEGEEDPDTTAIALQALLATGESDAAAAATDWLLDRQAEDGSVSSFGAANANSTAVAAQALRAAGEGEAADRAADFVAGLQVDEPPADAGSIKFTADEPQGNAFATIQGMLAFGAPALDEIEAAGAAPPVVAVLQ
jgi:hypothetical protein